MIAFAPADAKAFKLFHEGVAALAHVERAGIKVDRKQLSKSQLRLKGLISETQRDLHTSKEGLLWKRQFGANANFGSRAQLAILLYDVMGMEPLGKTKSGQYRTDREALERVDLPFVQKLLRVEQYKKMLSTYLNGIAREMTDKGFIHPFFNLHLVSTYRSSSDSPNFQNFPVRDTELAEYIRRCFIARRDDRHLVEIDFGGVEVCVSACYNQDPNLIADILDPTRDMHRDMACECFLLKPEQVTKPIRHAGKNKYVFPAFYGSYFEDIGRALWDAIEVNGLAVDGVGLKDHLKTKGIGNYKAFLSHIEKVDKRFWDVRFRVYAEWKRNFYRRYLKTGSFLTKTGFRVGGVMRRNEVTNYPIQGSAFHCLLWSLVRLNKELRRHKMKSLVVGQIHDSLVADVPANELDDFLALAVRVMTKDVRQYYKWITIPMTVEAEVAPLGGSWFDKKGYDIEQFV